MWSLILYVVCSMYVVCVCMYVVICKIDHCIHIHWCIVMGLGHNDPWVESHMWPQQTWGQRSSRVNDLWFKFLEKRVSVSTYFDVFSNLLNITMIAKVCDRESRRDSWFENRLVYYAYKNKLIHTQLLDVKYVFWTITCCCGQCKNKQKLDLYCDSHPSIYIEALHIFIDQLQTKDLDLWLVLWWWWCVVFQTMFFITRFDTSAFVVCRTIAVMIGWDHSFLERIGAVCHIHGMIHHMQGIDSSYKQTLKMPSC